MSSISPISNAQQGAEEQPTATTAARAALTQNIDTFLTLLTKQLENQDPLQPMDTNQFIDQLTQFSELEQGFEQTDILSEISGKLSSDERQQTIGLLGRAVEAESETLALPSSGSARFAFEITSPTEEAEMRIFDSGDNLVASFEVTGDLGRYDASWDGRLDDGGYAAPGLYRAQVVATSDSDQERLAGQVLSGGIVEEVRFESGTAQLILDGGQLITQEQVRRVATVPAGADS